MKDKNGYVLIRVGKTHPLADPNGYVREHILVFCSAEGRPLKPGEVIHHINEDRSDNRLENLAAMRIGQHNKLHPRKRESNGRFLKREKAIA